MGKNVAAANTRTGKNPLVGSIEKLCEVIVGNDFFREGTARARNVKRHRLLLFLTFYYSKFPPFSQAFFEKKWRAGANRGGTRCQKREKERERAACRAFPQRKICTVIALPEEWRRKILHLYRASRLPPACPLQSRRCLCGRSARPSSRRYLPEGADF